MSSTENSERNRGNVKNLTPHQFKPGQSGNPGGRPKRKPLTDIYAELIDQICPEDKAGRTYAELIARALVKEAIKGRVRAASELADRIEGRVVQGIAHSGEINGLADRIIKARERLGTE